MKFVAGIAVILLLIGSVFSAGLLVSGNTERMVKNEENMDDGEPQIEMYEGVEKEVFRESNHIGSKNPFLKRNMEGTIEGMYRSELLEEVPRTLSRSKEEEIDIEKKFDDDYTPREPIRIDGDDEFREKAAENDWPGNGSEENPYIIEGYEIDGEGHDHGIHITSTTVYFEVSNSYIHNADGHGISFNRVDNGYIINNIIAENGDRHDYGVYALLSERNTISGNVISNQFDGIYVSSSNNNRIINNTITHNEINGIRFWGADSNTIADNDIISNGFRAIFIRESKYTVVENNTMEESGIDFLGPEGGHGDPGDVGYWNTHEIYTNNTVNDRPVYYWKDEDGGTVPTGAGQVILGNCQNVTVKNQNITGGSVGIVIGYSRENTIVNNSIADVHHGISIKNSESPSIDQGNEIIDNKISNTSFAGIYFSVSSNQSLKNNTMGRQGGIYFRQIYDQTEREHWTTHQIDTSNTVNGKPIYYWSNEDEGSVPSDAGQVILAGCEDVTVKNQNISGAVAGIIVGYSDNVAVNDNTVWDTAYGIMCIETDDSAITTNHLSNNSNGIWIHDESKYNRLADNVAYNNSNRGIMLGSNSEKNTLVNNTMRGNEGTGISVLFADWNTIYHNKFIDNKYHANFIGFSGGNNEWNKPYPVGGNYWDDHTEPDEYSGPDQDEPGSDGIVDVSRDIPGSRRKDRYPWANPYFTSPINISDTEPPDNATRTAPNITLSVYLEAVSYPTEIEFYLEENKIYNETVESDGRVETDPLDLEYNTTYGWKVEATNDEGANWTESPTYSFTTGPEEPILTIEVEEGGTTEPEPGTYTYAYGEEVDIEAQPDEGWKFLEWTGDAPEEKEKDENITIVMDEDKVITAWFKRHTYNLDVKVEGQGSVNIEPNKEEYEFEEEVTLTAQPNEHWYLVEWTGDYTGTEEEITITMDEDKELTAWFEILEYDLELSVEGQGTTEPVEGSHTYEHGEELTLQASPEEGWVFSHWSGDVTGDQEEITVTIDRDMNLTAHFVEEPYFEVEITAPEDGEEFDVDEIVIEYTVRNTGGVEKTRTIELRVDGEVKASEELTLGPQEEYDGDLAWEAEEPDEYEVTVCSVNDEGIMDGADWVNIYVYKEETSDYGSLLTVIAFIAIGVLVLFVLMKKGKNQKKKDTKDLPILQKREMESED
ncbi:MAG: NosD domain-containing protein [Candidatus Thermoplasmatota archaeon]